MEYDFSNTFSTIDFLGVLGDTTLELSGETYEISMCPKKWAHLTVKQTLFPPPPEQDFSGGEKDDKRESVADTREGKG